MNVLHIVHVGGKACVDTTGPGALASRRGGHAALSLYVRITTKLAITHRLLEINKTASYLVCPCHQKTAEASNKPQIQEWPFPRVSLSGEIRRGGCGWDTDAADARSEPSQRLLEC